MNSNGVQGEADPGAGGALAADMRTPPGARPERKAGVFRSLGRGGLIVLSWVYGAVARWRRRRLEATARSLPVPVISVGNITCGGTGKTPTVEMIARDLLRHGRTPGFLSRGYGSGRSRTDTALYVPSAGPSSGAADGLREVAAGNDEFRVLASNVPEVLHSQGRDRHEQGLRAIAAGADVLVLDDGFQHVRLARDLDLVLVDALSPLGGGHVLPAGLLREPLEALGQADLIGITRSNQVEPMTLSTLSAYLRNLFPRVPQILMETRPVACVRLDGAAEPPETLGGRRTLAFCGIGNPEGFRRQLDDLGVEIAALVCFRDHHSYTDADLQKLRMRAEELRAAEVVMTQKDAVKVPASNFPHWRYLRVEQRIARGEDDYRQALLRALARKKR